MSDTRIPEETKIFGTGDETEETKVPVTSKNGEISSEEAKIPVTSPKSQNEDQDSGSVPVTVHFLEEKQDKKPKQPSKKERSEALKQKANKEFGSKRYAASIQLYNQALELDPSNHILYSNRAAARYNLAQEIASTGEHPDAKDHRAIQAESATWDAAMSLYFGALEDGLKAIELEPNFLKAYLRVGACLKALGKYQAAVQAYEAALSRFPNEESVKQALSETREKAAKLEEGFPLYHSFINLAAQPNTRAPDPPVAQPKSKDNAAAAAAAAAAARLHRELFGKRNALVQTPKPETRWQFYYEQPPNPRSTASWEPNPPRRPFEVDEDEEDHYYQEGEADEHFHRPSPSQSRFQRPIPPHPRYQQPQFFQQSQSQQHRPQHQQAQSSYQHQTYQQQPPYQQPYHQQHHQQQSQQQSYQAPQQSYQPHRKRSDNTSFPNRKATNGYLQELCENLRVSQYLPSLLEQGVETVDDLMLLPPEAIQSIFPTLGHQARVLDWLKKARGEI